MTAKIEEPLSFEERFRRFGQARTSDAEFEEWLDRDPERRAQWTERETKMREDRETIARIENELRAKHPGIGDREVYARAYAELLATKVELSHRLQGTRCPSVELRSAPAGKKVWVHVAYTGAFQGYAGGAQSFELTDEIFAQCIANLRASPQFKRGEGVLPFDWNHASEMNPSDLGELGAPAIGWVYDLKTQPGKDGRTDLYALVEWLPLATKYIKDGAYKWSSISIVFSGVDPVSGRNVGAFLTSIAATNSPFLQDLDTLRVAASRNFSSSRKEPPVDIDMTAVGNCPGRNQTEKLHSYLCATRVGFEKLSREAQFAQIATITAALRSRQLRNAPENIGPEWNQDAPRAPSGGTTPAEASGYVEPAARGAEFEALAKRLFPELESAEVQKVAHELQTAATYGKQAAHENSDWDAQWMRTGSWELYRSTMLPQALPERLRSRVSALEAAVRKAFADEHRTVSGLIAAGFFMSRTRAAGTVIDLRRLAGRNKFERARTWLSAHSPGYDRLSYDEQMKLAFDLAKSPNVVA